jgi:hypothetical protein
LITTAKETERKVSAADHGSLQHVLKNFYFPLFKTHLQVPKRFADPTERVVVPVAKLEQLYKIFERC